MLQEVRCCGSSQLILGADTNGLDVRADIGRVHISGRGMKARRLSRGGGGGGSIDFQLLAETCFCGV